MQGLNARRFGLGACGLGLLARGLGLLARLHRVALGRACRALCLAGSGLGFLRGPRGGVGLAGARLQAHALALGTGLFDAFVGLSAFTEGQCDLCALRRQVSQVTGLFGVAVGSPGGLGLGQRLLCAFEFDGGAAGHIGVAACALDRGLGLREVAVGAGRGLAARQRQDERARRGGKFAESVHGGSLVA